jgi:hypothetical protein
MNHKGHKEHKLKELVYNAHVFCDFVLLWRQICAAFANLLSAKNFNSPRSTRRARSPETLLKFSVFFVIFVPFVVKIVTRFGYGYAALGSLWLNGLSGGDFVWKN